MIKFTVYGNPVPKGRPRFGRAKHSGKPVTYTPVETEIWESYVRAQALNVRPEKLLDGPLALAATFYLMSPKSRPKGQAFPDRKPDLDNLVKAVKDALEGVIYTNDSRIVREVAEKRYGDPPRVEIAIYDAAEGSWLDSCGGCRDFAFCTRGAE